MCCRNHFEISKDVVGLLISGDAESSGRTSLASPLLKARRYASEDGLDLFLTWLRLGRGKLRQRHLYQLPPVTPPLYLCLVRPACVATPAFFVPTLVSHIPIPPPCSRVQMRRASATQKTRKFRSSVRCNDMLKVAAHQALHAGREPYSFLAGRDSRSFSLNLSTSAAASV